MGAVFKRPRRRCERCHERPAHFAWADRVVWSCRECWPLFADICEEDGLPVPALLAPRRCPCCA